MLKKVIQLFMLSLYLLSCTELQELTKIPVLFQHYFEHKQLDQNITFIGYIKHHYEEAPHNDNDEQRDNQLPFKTHDFCAANIVTHSLPTSIVFTWKRACLPIQKAKMRVNNELIPSAQFAEKIWQPPKSVFA